MAMKSVNNIVKLLGIVAVAALLFGCGASNVVKDAKVEYTLVDTSSYLPVDSFDKEGVLLPYKERANLYLDKNGRIKKQSVQLYIDARRAFKSKQYSAARKSLNVLVEQDKKLSGPWVMLGDIALAEGAAEEAEQHFRKAISINHTNINGLLRLAKVLRVKGSYIEAQNIYAKALDIWPDFPEAHLNLAILYDLYLNRPLLAQQHMEAYQFLAKEERSEVNAWLSELRTRTGVDYSIKAGLKLQAENATGAPITNMEGVL